MVPETALVSNDAMALVAYWFFGNGATATDEKIDFHSMLSKRPSASAGLSSSLGTNAYCEDPTHIVKLDASGPAGAVSLFATLGQSSKGVPTMLVVASSRRGETST